MIDGESARRQFFYGWVIVAFSMLLMAANATVINAFGVFFKPVSADFGWNRAETSLAQSILFICNGVFAIAMGWLADRFGRGKVLAMCGVLIGLGLVLTSRISTLWQIYLTFAVTGIGLSSVFAVTGVATARWFRERRGLALGLASAGVGLGNFAGVPAVARLIAAYGWSRTYLALGIAVFLIVVAGAYFLRRNPKTPEPHPSGLNGGPAEHRTGSAIHLNTVSPSVAVRTRAIWLLFGIFLLFTFSNQMVMVHLVNYATDIGVLPLVAATLVSVVGLSSIAGRISMGGASDRIGNINALIVACLGALTGLFVLISARGLWMFYLFTAIYGFAHGAEVPQQTALVGKFFGLRTMLVAIVHCGAAIGGALGAWVGGQVFDVTQSYQVAFYIGVAAITTALTGTLLLRKAPSLLTRPTLANEKA